MTHYVRVNCEEHDCYLRTTQTILDANWVPEGHEGCTIVNFVVEKEETEI